MKLNHIFAALFASAVAVSLSACGGNDDGEPGEGGGNAGNESTATIEDSKEYIASVAQDFMSYFKAADQKDMVQVIDHVQQQYGNLELDEDYFPLREVGNSVMLDAVSDYKGVFEPQGYQWVKVSNSNDLVFRIKNDPVYGTIELTGKRSGGSSNITVDSDDDYIYDITIPQVTEVTLVAAGKTIFTQKLDVTFAQNKNLAATLSFNGGKISYVQSVNATNTNANVSTTLSVNGQQLLSANGTLNGSNLCDYKTIMRVMDDEDYGRILKNGSLSGNVLGRVDVNGRMTYNEELFEAFDECYDWGAYGEYESKSEALKMCNQGIETIKRYVSVTANFNNSAANITFVPDVEEWESWNGEVYGEYIIMPALEFADGTTYAEDYFSTGFQAVINQWEALVRSYENMFD